MTVRSSDPDRSTENVSNLLPKEGSGSELRTAAVSHLEECGFVDSVVGGTTLMSFGGSLARFSR